MRAHTHTRRGCPDRGPTRADAPRPADETAGTSMPPCPLHAFWRRSAPIRSRALSAGEEASRGSRQEVCGARECLRAPARIVDVPPERFADRDIAIDREHHGHRACPSSRYQARGRRTRRSPTSAGGLEIERIESIARSMHRRRARLARRAERRVELRLRMHQCVAPRRRRIQADRHHPEQAGSSAKPTLWRRGNNALELFPSAAHAASDAPCGQRIARR
jgi:hypothetical protein